VGGAIALTHEREQSLEEALIWLGEASVRTSRDAKPFAAQQVDILEDHSCVLR
jgi:hypothetical protein